MVIIYILECIEGKYYVGKTNRPIENRIHEHLNLGGSAWTKLYTPIAIKEIINNADEFSEDLYTKKYMKKYGIENVRGGSYVKIILPDYQLITLQKELDLSDNRCFKCHKQGHFIKKCHGDDINVKNKFCKRCYRQGHDLKECYAKKYINGDIINENNTCVIS